MDDVDLAVANGVTHPKFVHMARVITEHFSGTDVSSTRIMIFSAYR